MSKKSKLDKDFFFKQLTRLVVEFKDKGFTMSKERVSQWYEFFEVYSKEDLKIGIDNYLKSSSYIPSMSDILNSIKKHKNPYKRE